MYRVILLLVTFISLTAPYLVWGSEYVVTPRVIDRNVEARDLLSETIKISNTSATPIKVYPTVNAIDMGADGEIIAFTAPVTTDQTTNIASWLAIARGRVELLPGETKELPLSITINPNAKPGTYYAFIGFAEGHNRDEAEATVAAGRAPGVTLSLTIADVKNEYLRLNQFSVERFVRSGTEAPVTYELENIGDKAVVPTGEIILYDVRGTEVSSITVNPENKSIPAGGKETFTGSVSDTGAFGRHKAFLNVEYGSGQRANLYDTTFFTVIPFTILLVAFAILLTITLFLTLLYHRKQKRSFVYQDDESVALYVREGVTSNIKDHDINLKKE